MHEPFQWAADERVKRMTATQENLYEGMFLLDAREVRREGSGLEAEVLGLLEKQGARIERAGRWEERRLAYEIRGHRRAVYFLAFFRVKPEALPAIRREAGLAPGILRVLLLRAETVVGEDFFKRKDSEGSAGESPKRGDRSSPRPAAPEAAGGSGGRDAPAAPKGATVPATADPKE